MDGFKIGSGRHGLDLVKFAMKPVQTHSPRANFYDCSSNDCGMKKQVKLHQQQRYFYPPLSSRPC